MNEIITDDKEYVYISKYNPVGILFFIIVMCGIIGGLLYLFL